MTDSINSYHNVISSHFSNFPIGLIILSKNQKDNSNYIISFINSFANSILPMRQEKYLSQYKDLLSSFRKRELNQLSKITLWDSIMNSNEKESNENYYSESLMVYIKIKFMKEYVYISIDNLNEQRQMLQEKIIKSICFRFLTTLAHELNNPLNSLLSTLEQIKSDSYKTIKLLVCLIKSVAQKLIVYSKCIFDSVQWKERNAFLSSQFEIVNLQYLFVRLGKKYDPLFEYKKIQINNEDFSLLDNCLFKCDRYYIKELIKNLWMYLYYQVPKYSQIAIMTVVMQNPNRISLTFEHKGITEPNMKQEPERIFLNESNNVLDASVNTIETFKEILTKVSKFLDVDLYFIEEGNRYFTLEFKEIIFDQHISDDDELDINEFDSSRNNSLSQVPTFSSMSTFDYLKSSKKNVLESSCPPSRTGTLSNKNNITSATTLSDYTTEQNNQKKSARKQPKEKSKGYNNITACLGRSLVHYLEKMKDPVIENLKESSPNTPAKPLKKDNENNKTSDQDDFQRIATFRLGTKSQTLNENPITKDGAFNMAPKQMATVPELTFNYILIVDDEEYNYSAINNLLARQSLSAAICTNGLESIQYLRKHPNIKLVFMDIYMPVMDGLEACKLIQEMVDNKEINPDISVVIVSAHPPETIEPTTSQYKNVKLLLKKPMNKPKLLKVLQDFYA